MTIRIGVIGTGRAGLIHARAFQGHIPAARLTAICDPGPEALSAARSRLGGVAGFADYRELLAADVDAVVIATPTKYHRQIAVDAAAAGKHVLCEKPMAISEDECRDMIEAAERAAVKLQIGFMRRFDAGHVHAKRLVEDGAIGEVVAVKSLTHGPSVPHPWMYDLKASNGPSPRSPATTSTRSAGSAAPRWSTFRPSPATTAAPTRGRSSPTSTTP